MNADTDAATLGDFVAALDDRDGVRATALGDGEFQIVVDSDKTGLSIDLADTGPATFTEIAHTNDGVRYDGVFEP